MPSSGRIVIVTDAGVLVAVFVDDGIWGELAWEGKSWPRLNLSILRSHPRCAVCSASERSMNVVRARRLRTSVISRFAGHHIANF
jgi:hypothetical protein